MLEPARAWADDDTGLPDLDTGEPDFAQDTAVLPGPGAEAMAWA